ncbi:MAG: hypothetical protein ACXADB_14045 [Candidatus Hermodarchaeia archaeon]|jgi:hypothetical protein
MRDLYQIKRADDSTLLFLTKKRIDAFRILKLIYDDEYLLELIRHKNDFDNSLLSWLVIDTPIDQPIAFNMFREIEENIILLESDDAVNVIKGKLRQWNTSSFESAVTELEFVAEYLRKGYHVELEPKLPNGRTGDSIISFLGWNCDDGAPDLAGSGFPLSHFCRDHRGSLDDTNRRISMQSMEGVIASCSS